GRIQACLGFCSAKLVNHPAAIARENSALEAGFATAEVYNNRGYSELMMRKLESAQEDFAKAIQLNGSLQAPHYNMAVLELVRAHQGKSNISSILQGVDHINEALKIGPERADLYYTGAKLFSVAREIDNSYTDSALKFLEKAILLGLPPSQLESDVAGFK